MSSQEAWNNKEIYALDKKARTQGYYVNPNKYEDYDSFFKAVFNMNSDFRKAMIKISCTQNPNTCKYCMCKP